MDEKQTKWMKNKLDLKFAVRLVDKYPVITNMWDE